MVRRSVATTARATPTSSVQMSSSTTGCCPTPSTSWTTTWHSRVQWLSVPHLRIRRSSLSVTTSVRPTPCALTPCTIRVIVHHRMPSPVRALYLIVSVRTMERCSWSSSHHNHPSAVTSRRTLVVMVVPYLESLITQRRMVYISLYILLNRPRHSSMHGIRGYWWHQGL
jgi:hypothetical protein